MEKDILKEILDKVGSSPILLDGLPFSGEQKQWIAGFLSGMQMQVEEMPGFGATQGKPISIIYGTQTGNAESMAYEAASIAKDNGLAPEVIDMSDVELSTLVTAERILVVTSTYGEGEMPDNAQLLWEAISANDAPRMDHAFFSVLALGDTSYDGFCTAGKEWDERLEALGATRVYARVDCDVDFEDDSMEWIHGVMPIITTKGSQDVKAVGANKPIKTIKPKYTRKNPLHAVLKSKKVLSGEQSTKEIVHYEFSLGKSGEQYLAGDALNIIPQNRPDLIDQLLSLFGNYPDDITMDKLIHELEIRTPSKELVEKVAANTEDEEFKRMVENGDKEAISDFLWGYDSYQLIKNYGNKKISFIDFFNSCKPLTPRAYSISSSIKKHENEVHLTISSVRYKTDNRSQNGVTSTFLSDFVEVGEKVKCYFSPNKQFKIPSDNTLPAIMVGPGTGIAPFRAFLEEREAIQATGKNWLFFGDRNQEHDFIYKEELEAMQASGLLDRLNVAFSRDQLAKIYVQDKMREHGEELFKWLEEGAYFYVCGDAYRMAKDVDVALHQVIATYGNTSRNGAVDYVKNLKKQKRYVRDVY